MIHFIPAWYRTNEWRERGEAWYRPREASEYDDTVKEIQLFSRSGLYPYEIMLLSYAPNFRHFLHRQSIFHASYWSLFDAMQGITRHRVAMRSYHEEEWPADVRFLETPFCVLAYRGEEKYARIDFASDGNMYQIDYYEENLPIRRNRYDDRGFLSSVIRYGNGVPETEEYLDEAGVWKFRRNLSDGHVHVNPANDSFTGPFGIRFYEKETYDSLEDLMGEVFDVWIGSSSGEDLFCIAMDLQHDRFLEEHLFGKTKILSFYEKRGNVLGRDETEHLVHEAGRIVVDTEETRTHVLEAYPEEGDRIVRISPFTSRVESSASQEVPVRNILIETDGLTEETLYWEIRALAQYLKKDPKARAVLFTRESGSDRETALKEIRKEALAGNFPESSGTKEEEEGEELSERFLFASCPDELSVNRTLQENRLLIDLGDQPDPFLQISAMSLGIPQITLVKTEYIEDGRNGRILSDISELPETLEDYLGNLAHWNSAMIASYEMGNAFSTVQVKKDWEEIIRDLTEKKEPELSQSNHADAGSEDSGSAEQTNETDSDTDTGKEEP